MFLLAAALSLSSFSLVCNAQSNIDPAKSYAWSENFGWIDLHPSDEFGVQVDDTFLSGYAWSENGGWIYFGGGPEDNLTYTNTGSDHGVNRQPSGALTGFAWGENLGWINFDTNSVSASQVVIDNETGEFSGFAWSESGGWINFGEGYDQGLKALIDASVDDWALFE